MTPFALITPTATAIAWPGAHPPDACTLTEDAFAELVHDLSAAAQSAQDFERHEQTPNQSGSGAATAEPCGEEAFAPPPAKADTLEPAKDPVFIVRDALAEPNVMQDSGGSPSRDLSSVDVASRPLIDVAAPVEPPQPAMTVHDQTKPPPVGRQHDSLGVSDHNNIAGETALTNERGRMIWPGQPARGESDLATPQAPTSQNRPSETVASNESAIASRDRAIRPKQSSATQQTLVGQGEPAQKSQLRHSPQPDEPPVEAQKATAQPDAITQRILSLFENERPLVVALPSSRHSLPQQSTEGPPNTLQLPSSASAKSTADMTVATEIPSMREAYDRAQTRTDAPAFPAETRAGTSQAPAEIAKPTTITAAHTHTTPATLQALASGTVPPPRDLNNLGTIPASSAPMYMQDGNSSPLPARNLVSATVPERADQRLTPLLAASTARENEPNEPEARLASLPPAPLFAGASSASATPVLRQLSAAVASAPAGEHVIKLAPDELGQVVFRIARDEAGLTITILAERSEIAQLLRRHGETLINDLREQGIEDATLDFGSEAQGRQRDDNHKPGAASLENSARDAPAPVAPPPQAKPPHSGSVDLRM